MTSVKYSFSGYTITGHYGIAPGPISNSMYYLDTIYTPYYSVIRKQNFDGSAAWIAAFSFTPIQKSLAVDSNEQYVYFGNKANPLDVVRLASSTGTIFDSQRHSFLNGQSFDIKIHLLSDNTGYYVSGADSSNRANI